MNNGKETAFSLYVVLVLLSFNVTRCSELATQSIPIIDLSQSDEMNAISARAAATQYGFFYVVNHGIPLVQQKGVLGSSKMLFDLDKTTKNSLAMNDTHWGYIKYGSEKTDASSGAQSVGDTKEGFYLYNERNINDTQSSPLASANKWPPYSSKYSDDDWTGHMQSYMQAMHHLSVRLCDILALALDLPIKFFSEPGVRDSAIDLMYLLHYPAFKSDTAKGIFGTGAHTDYDFFTILLTDDEPGLQIRHEEESDWYDVEYMENAFIVNIADAFGMWTNGIFRSAEHRVVLNGDNDRYSIPYFVAFNYDLFIDCLATTMIADHDTYATCNHEPFVYGKYLQQKLASSIEGYFDTDELKSGSHQEL